jgi:hypothetical protein
LPSLVDPRKSYTQTNHLKNEPNQTKSNQNKQIKSNQNNTNQNKTKQTKQNKTKHKILILK